MEVSTVSRLTARSFPHTLGLPGEAERTYVPRFLLVLC